MAIRTLVIVIRVESIDRRNSPINIHRANALREAGAPVGAGWEMHAGK